MDENKTWVIGEGFVIFGLSALSYVSAFSYEMGYCGFFGIPPSLIRPDLTVLLAYAVAIGSSVMGLLTPIDKIWSWLVKSQNPNPKIWQSMLRIMSPAVLILAIALLFSLLSWSWRPMIVMAGALLIVSVGFCGSKGEATFFSRYTVDWTDHSRILSALVVAVPFLSFLIGEQLAAKETRFFTPNYVEQSVVVRIYGDRVICAAISEAEHKILPKMFLLQGGEGFARTFERREIGKLKPSPR